MSQENVEAFERAVAAYNRGDIDSFLEEVDPDVEWHPLLQVMLGGRSNDVSRARGRPKNLPRSEREPHRPARRDVGDQGSRRLAGCNRLYPGAG